MSQSISREDRIRGALLGLAWGFLSHRANARRSSVRRPWRSLVALGLLTVLAFGGIFSWVSPLAPWRVTEEKNNNVQNIMTFRTQFLLNLPMMLGLATLEESRDPA